MSSRKCSKCGARLSLEPECPNGGRCDFVEQHEDDNAPPIREFELPGNGVHRFMAYLIELVRVLRSPPAPPAQAMALVTFDDGRWTQSKLVRFVTSDQQRDVEFRGFPRGKFTLRVVNVGTLPLCMVEVTHLGRVYAQGPLLEFQFEGEPAQTVKVLIKALVVGENDG